MRWPVIFALATALCWGVYGPALGKSRAALHSPFTPYVAIGLAYLIWGVGGGVLGMLYNGDQFSLSGAGGVWGFIAGTLGAWGAFTLTLAMFSGGTAMPNVVMPIVFGGAVTVSALVSLYSVSNKAQVNPMLYVGVVGMFICIVIVAYYTPHAAPHGKPSAVEPPAADAPADAE